MGGLFSSAPEFPTNEGADHLVIIAAKLEELHPGLFMFDLRQDPGTTGRLEVTIVLNYKNQSKASKILIHQKSKGQGYPSSNWNAFTSKVNQALQQISK
ncbi:UNKNOWN [Stylonychia lemnae]|uniref:Uncharacterized protein n=1 Tax=Stylonychia lemnae TaxID=5949 RepID=A0A077ZWY1_STYLE|nr:UNKNOWN [Stylonychia lemnae]|eukprot:CDW74421.1 UNKNOWN [Stylonychia lemnae]